MRILQIMPAPGWVARFDMASDAHASDVDDAGVEIPLVGWALVDFEDGSRDVVGLVCSKQNGISIVDEQHEGFMGYECKETES